MLANERKVFARDGAPGYSEEKAAAPMNYPPATPLIFLLDSGDNASIKPLTGGGDNLNAPALSAIAAAAEGSLKAKD